MKKKLLTLLLSVFMVVTTFTVNVFAEDIFIIVDDIKYKVIEGTNTAEVYYTDNFTGTTVTIPKTISDGNGKEYTVTSFGSGVFSENNTITSVTIPDSFTFITESTFEGCRSLVSVTLPDSIKDIQNNAFFECNKLASINIPKNLTTIGDSAFAGCKAIETITLPNSVTTIDSYAFYNCTKLSNVTINKTNPPSLGSYAFGLCPESLKIYVPASAVDTYKNAWSGYKDKIVAIPATIADILATLEGGLPTGVDSWINSLGCIVNASSEYLTFVFDGPYNINTSNNVTKNGDYYEYTSSNNVTYKFQLDSNGKLDNIIVSGHETTEINGTFAKPVTIEFNMQSRGTQVSSQKIPKGTTATAPTAPVDSINGYIFEGWFNNAEYTSSFDFTTAITENKTLFAKWREPKVSDMLPDNFPKTEETAWLNGDSKLYLNNESLYINDSQFADVTLNTTVYYNMDLKKYYWSKSTGGVTLRIDFNVEGEPSVLKNIEISGVPSPNDKINGTYSPKQAITPSVSLTGWTYGDSANTPSVTGNTGSGTVTYKYKVKDAEDSTYTADVPKKAGTYVIKAEIAETTDYLAGTATSEFTISPRQLAVTGTTVNNKIYDATVSVIIDNNGTLTNKVDGDDVSLDDVVATYDDPSAGDNKPVTVQYTIKGNDVSNYIKPVDNTSLTSNIIKAPQTGVSSSPYSGLYDGASHTIAVVPDGGTVSYSLEEDGTYTETAPTFTNVTSGSTVFFKVSKDNYEDYKGSNTVTIIPVPLYVSLTKYQEEYTGNEIKPTVTINGLVNDESLIIDTDYTVSYSNNINVGTATATVTLLDSVKAKNYKFTEGSNEVSFDITRKEIEVPIAENGLVYSGEELIGVKDGNGYTLSNNKAINVGDYEAKVNVDSNHKWDDGTTIEKTISWSIAQADGVVDVDTTTITKNYGETLVLPVATSNFGTVKCDKTATDLVNVGTYVVTYSLDGTDNYTGDTKTLTVVINKANDNEITDLFIDNWSAGEDVSIPSAKAKYGNISYSYAKKVDGVSKEDLVYEDTAPSEIGEYWLKATVESTDNYNGVDAYVSFYVFSSYSKDGNIATGVNNNTDIKDIELMSISLQGAKVIFGDDPVFKKAIEDGEDVVVYIEINEIKDRDIFKSEGINGDNAVLLEINFYGVIASDPSSKKQLFDTDVQMLTIKVTLTADQAKKIIKSGDVSYYVLREHDGTIDKLSARVNKDNGNYVFIFETNKFSSYALCSKVYHHYVVPDTSVKGK